jgi:hypothetical protein
MNHQPLRNKTRGMYYSQWLAAAGANQSFARAQETATIFARGRRGYALVPPPEQQLHLKLPTQAFFAITLFQPFLQVRNATIFCIGCARNRR